MCLYKILRKGLAAVAAVFMMYVGILVITLETNISCTASADHPEQMVRLKEKEKSIVTLEDVAKFAEEYIQKNSKEGLFLYYDKHTKKELELIFDKIHREKLSQTKKNEYFVCADFKGKDGKTYDLDFFVQGKSRNYFTIDKKGISLHKVNGKENYTWNYNEKKDVWEKKAIIIEREYPEPTKREHPGYP
ncbi:MAG: hypothetical protein CV087_15235 [Candidatus Brocadia sp. WS118]|nr:MAG: hypothetical protein CV087_15235 [Candidatus Brocadia sp. WS118]